MYKAKQHQSDFHKIHKIYGFYKAFKKGNFWLPFRTCFVKKDDTEFNFEGSSQNACQVTTLMLSLIILVSPLALLPPSKQYDNETTTSSHIARSATLIVSVILPKASSFYFINVDLEASLLARGSLRAYRN